MKPSTLLGLILVVGTVYSVPLDMDSGEEQDEPVVPDPTEESPMNVTEDMGEIEEMEDKNRTMFLEEPSALFLEEVKECFREQELLKSSDRVTRQITGALSHGNTIALQTFVRNQWLSCAGSAGSSCTRRGCPLMDFRGNDWSTCGGETFQIYRAYGPGLVRVGDLIGLYYGGGLWFGCWLGACYTASCPGYPSYSHGFATQDKWYQCSGEVYRIYAKGKAQGAVIHSNDDVVLYYLQEQRWVSQGSGLTVKQPCLGTSRPPPINNYDGCANEHFRVWKREY